MADLLEPEAAQVAEQEVRRAVVGDEEVDPAVVVEVGGDDAQPPAVAVDDPGLGGDVDEPAAVVAEDVIGQRLDDAGVAGDDDRCPTGPCRRADCSVSQTP